MIILAAMLAYWPAVRGEFLWDDENYIDRPPATPTSRLIHADDGLRDIWLTTQATDYWPLTNTAFWIQWRLWGMDSTGYHVVNICLHALGAILVWRVLRRLRVGGAWLGAMLFAVHPAAVASVAWISELKNCLSLPLYAAALLAWLRFEDSGRRRWYALALLAFLLALTAKTSVVMLPVVLLGLAWWRRGKIGWKDVLRSAPFFALSLAMGLATAWFQREHGFGQEVARPEGLLSRVAASGWVVGFYVCKALIPVRLSAIYPRWQVDPASVTAWVPLTALLVVVAVAWRFREKWGRPMLTALGYVVVTLVPVLGLLAMSYHRFSLVADHLQYLALPASAALVAALTARLMRRGGAWRAVATGIGAVLVLAALALTWQRAKVFRTSESLWRDTLAKNPISPEAHNNLGRALAWQGKLPEAIVCFERAVGIKPDYAEAHNNLGTALFQQGKFPEAAVCFERAVAIKPDHAKAHNNLGTVLAQQGRLPEAIVCFERAVAIAPGYAEAHNNLGAALARQRKLPEAAVCFERAVAIAPDYAEALNNLGTVLAQQGRLPEAVVCFDRAVTARPDYVEARRNRDKVRLMLRTSRDPGGQ